MLNLCPGVWSLKLIGETVEGQVAVPHMVRVPHACSTAKSFEEASETFSCGYNC